MARLLRLMVVVFVALLLVGDQAEAQYRRRPGRTRPPRVGVKKVPKPAPRPAPRPAPKPVQKGYLDGGSQVLPVGVPVNMAQLVYLPTLHGATVHITVPDNYACNQLNKGQPDKFNSQDFLAMVVLSSPAGTFTPTRAIDLGDRTVFEFTGISVSGTADIWFVGSGLAEVLQDAYPEFINSDTSLGVLPNMVQSGGTILTYVGYWD